MTHFRQPGLTDAQYEAQHAKKLGADEVIKFPTLMGVSGMASGEDGDPEDIAPSWLIGMRFQAIRRDDGSHIVLDRLTGGPLRNPDKSIMILAPAAPDDPDKPNISFHTDPNTGAFFSFDQTSGILTVISKEDPNIHKGFQYVPTAQTAIINAGLDPSTYNYVYEDGKVVPTLIEQIPPSQESFFTATDASGQLLVVSRLTGETTKVGAAPKGDDVPAKATVEIDPLTKQFKVTQPNGRISFLEAPKDIEKPTEVTIGDQTFAFNPNTGGFQQVQEPPRPAREFDPDVRTIKGRKFIQGPDGRLTLLPPEFQPGVVTVGGRKFIQSPTGGLTPLEQQFEPGVVTEGDREFTRDASGRLTPLSREFDPDVVTIGERAFIQGPGGALTPLGREEVPNLDELINQRIISGDAPGALALSDFRDRPTSLEAFNAAMQFAQSPGDVAAISAISRGQTLVSPPPTGDVQRIAEQPEFLQDAYSRLINQFRGGTGSPEQFIDVLTRINKEADDRKTSLVAQEREATALKEKNQQLTFSAQMASALVPFREQIASLSSELAAFKTTAGGTTAGAAVGAAVDSGDTGGVPGTSGTPFPFDATVTSPTTDAFNEGAKLAVASGLTGDAARHFALQFVEQQEEELGEEAVGAGTGEDPQSVDPASLEERLARVDAQREGNKARRERENILVQQRKREQDARDNIAATGTTPPMEGFSRLPTSEDELIAESYLDEPTMPAAFKQEIRMEHRLGRDEAVGAPLTPLQMDQISQGVYPPPPSVPLLPPAKKSGEKTALTPFQMDQLSQGVDALRHGGITSGSNLEIVGEGGAELVDLPPGTRVTPLSKLGKDKVKKLKEMGVIGMQEGGIVGPLLPFGVRRALAGGIIEPTRRRLSRAAGLPVLSAQARQNLLPEELDVFNRLSREAGIPEGAFKQEQQSAFPGANLTRGRTRFAPRVLR